MSYKNQKVFIMNKMPKSRLFKIVPKPEFLKLIRD